MANLETIMLDSVEELDEELILKLINMHKIHELPRIKKLRNYYEGKHEILNRTFADDSKPNNKIIVNYAKYAVDVINGYFMGKPVTYTCQDENALLYINDTYERNGEQAHNSMIAKNASIFGVSYELLFLDENGDVRFTPLRNEEVIMIYSTSVIPEPIAAIRYYKIKNYKDNSKSIEKVEVYTKELVSYYTNYDGALTLTNETPNYFGEVQIIPYYNNDEEIGDFEGIIGLQDAYNATVSDISNDFAYTADSYLLLSGVEDTDPDVYDNMKRNRIMLMPEGGSASWLTKQTDVAYISEYLDRLEDSIHRVTYVPNISDIEFGSQVSGTALSYRFQALEQLSAGKERLFKNSLNKRAELVFNILAIRGLNFDDTNVKAMFKRNMPVNNEEAVSMVQSLYGIVSKDTLLAQLPFVDNPQEELDKIDTEKYDPYSGTVFDEE